MNVISAIRLVLQARPYRYLALELFVLALTAYVFTLPAAYTGGVVGLISLSYLTSELLLFSLALAALLSLALTLNIYAFRASIRPRSSGLSLGPRFLASYRPASAARRWCLRCWRSWARPRRRFSASPGGFRVSSPPTSSKSWVLR